MNRKTTAVFLTLAAAAMLLGGCKKEAAKPVSPATEAAETTVSAGLARPEASALKEYYSPDIEVSFQYPGGWSTEEGENFIVLSSPEDEDSAIMIADVSFEISLFLAGGSDMEDAVDALIGKYSDVLSGDAVRDNYEYDWNQDDNGNVRAKAGFNFENDGKNYVGLVDGEQVGGRVFLSVCIAPADERKDAAWEVYNGLNESFTSGGVDSTLEAADLGALGFPEAPGGYGRLYSPVTGQFLIYPDSCTILTGPEDDGILLANEKGAMMYTENWTKKFNKYTENGYDAAQCFEEFLTECRGALETICGETPQYQDPVYQNPANQELVKAGFDYTISTGTGHCFAELGRRPWDGTDYVQATMFLYKPGDRESVNMFNPVTDSSLILFPGIGVTGYEQ